jgi:hypothetical protein
MLYLHTFELEFVSYFMVHSSSLYENRRLENSAHSREWTTMLVCEMKPRETGVFSSMWSTGLTYTAPLIAVWIKLRIHLSEHWQFLTSQHFHESFNKHGSSLLSTSKAILKECKTAARKRFLEFVVLHLSI